MNHKQPILLVGAGGHAKSCIDVIESTNDFAVYGLVGLGEQVGSSIMGYPVLGTDSDLPELRKKVSHALVVIGQVKTAEPRIRLYERLQSLGFTMPVIVSKNAYVSTRSKVGSGTIVMHGAVVNASVSIGVNCIINSQSLLEHDAVVGDHTHISTKATLNGAVSVGVGAFIGSGSVLKECISIGDGCIVGMGLKIKKSLPSGVMQTKEQ